MKIERVYEIDEELGKICNLVIKPDYNKCFMNKITGHKFINTKTGLGLELKMSPNEVKFYEEVVIDENKKPLFEGVRRYGK